MNDKYYCPLILEECREWKCPYYSETKANVVIPPSSQVYIPFKKEWRTNESETEFQERIVVGRICNNPLLEEKAFKIF